VRTIGAALLVVSAFTAVAGMSMHLAPTSEAAIVAALTAVPAGLIVLAPTLVTGAGLSRRSGRLDRHRRWVVASVGASTAAGLALLVLPPDLPGATITALRSLAFAIVGMLAALLIHRHRWLWRIGRLRASIAAVAASIALTAIWAVATVMARGSVGWWAAQLIDVTSVVVLAWAVARYPRDRSSDVLLAPITNRDPAAALELGLTPEVRRFVASLQRKDPQTRDHVARTAELAIRVALRGGLHPRTVRRVGLGALLHDIGKLTVPMEILAKPGRLDPSERSVIEGHAAAGAAMIEASPALAGVAPIVRWHHERFDGSGYPDGIAGADLPLEAAIVSACDAWDAMTWARHYRGAMSFDAAADILRNGAGSQWSPLAVELVLAEVRSWEATEPHLPSAFERTGTDADAELPMAVCADALAGVELTGR
jgi:putative nucleotidyltransferase with HDIG domain